MDYRKVAEVFAHMCQEILGDNLVGVYLHGSAAMGCFNPQKSDLDLLVVVENSVSDEVKIVFMEQLVKLNNKAPEKGIEMSIVKRSVCNPFCYPTPFELHFSNTHLNWFLENPQDYIAKMQGTDPDLAAHVTITRAYGRVLYGAKISDVFGMVPKEDYIDSIWLDIENAAEDILENSVYVILNLCRVLAYLKEDLILSKKDGGMWGLRFLEQTAADMGSIKNAKDNQDLCGKVTEWTCCDVEKFRKLILVALTYYTEEKMEADADLQTKSDFSEDVMKIQGESDSEWKVHFAEMMLCMIKNCRDIYV